MKARWIYCLSLILLLGVACSPQPANSSGKNARRGSTYSAHSTKGQKKTPTQSNTTQKKTSQKYSAQKIYKMCNPAVFTVTTSNNIYTAQGSGFFISSSGLAVSNYHVFKGSFKGAEVIYMASGKQYKVKEVIKTERRKQKRDKSQIMRIIKIKMIKVNIIN